MLKIESETITFPRRLVNRTRTWAIIIHHTAGSDMTVTDMHAMHIRRGLGGIAYHYLIRPDGTIYAGRPLQAHGAHARNNNHNSIGIALSGNFELSRPAARQMSALRNLIRHIRAQHPHWADLPVMRHKDIAATLCPGRFFRW